MACAAAATPARHCDAGSLCVCVCACVCVWLSVTPKNALRKNTRRGRANRPNPPRGSRETRFARVCLRASCACLRQSQALCLDAVKNLWNAELMDERRVDVNEVIAVSIVTAAAFQNVKIRVLFELYDARLFRGLLVP